MTNLNRRMPEGAEEPLAIKARIVRESREMRLTLTGNFDALQTVEKVSGLLRPAGYYERIILDFSRASRVEPSALYRLFVELSQCPDFNYIEICIEGLEFGYERGRTGFVEN